MTPKNPGIAKKMIPKNLGIAQKVPKNPGATQRSTHSNGTSPYHDDICKLTPREIRALQNTGGALFYIAR